MSFIYESPELENYFTYLSWIWNILHQPLGCEDDLVWTICYPVDWWGECSPLVWFTMFPFHSWMLKLWDWIEKISISIEREGTFYCQIKEMVPPHYHILEYNNSHQHFYTQIITNLCNSNSSCYYTYLQGVILILEFQYIKLMKIIF